MRRESTSRVLTEDRVWGGDDALMGGREGCVGVWVCVSTGKSIRAGESCVRIETFIQ